MGVLASISNLAPLRLRPAEWVGVCVLVLAVIAVWAIFHRSRLPAHTSRARRCGGIALALITLAIWVGVATRIEILAAIILTCGAIFSLSAVFLSLGMTWRGHLRPALTPIFLGIAILIAAWFALPSTIAVVLLAAIWMWRRRRQTLLDVDREIHNLLTRVLAIQYEDAAQYLVHSWFQRHEREASTLSLLALAERVKETLIILPVGSSTAIVTKSLEAVDQLASPALDARLGTDGAAGRPTSWIRVLTGLLLRTLVRNSGVGPLLRFLTNLLLAVPPKRKRQEEGADQDQAAVPEPTQYVAGLIESLPVTPTKSDLERMIERVKLDSERIGEKWLLAVASAAEQKRQQSPRARREYRTELVAEVLWALHESLVGPRPDHYDVFDQLRLQVPELLDGLAVHDVAIEKDTGALNLSLQGLPLNFLELSASKSKVNPKHPITVETRDHRRWQFERVHVGDEQTVQMTFRPSK